MRVVGLAVVSSSALLLAATLPCEAAEPTPEGLKAFASLKADPPPPKTTRNRHYAVSNEDEHEKFYPEIKDLGGIVMGVGTDQMYLFGAWANADILVLMDFDQVVVDLHEIYRLLLLETPDPAAFVEAWHARNEANVEALIRKVHKGEYGDRLVEYLKTYRQVIFARLRKLRVRYRRFGDVPSFVNDQAQYDRLVALYRKGRVFAVRGDLTGPHTMQAIAAAASKSGVPMRVLYPSNAEQYFSWKKQYRDNILAFPFDADSLIIRTKACADPKTPKNCYKYYVQKGANFQKWMHSKEIRGIRRMLFTALPKGTRGLLELRKGPPDV